MTGFGLAQVKEEGSTSIWDAELGDYRKASAEEIAAYKVRLDAEWAYSQSFPGRLKRFFYRIGRAGEGLWSNDD